jgi:hypothetical protein
MEQNLKKAIILHYESKIPILCYIKTSSVDNFFSVEFSDEISFSLHKGDPVVIGIPIDHNIEVLGGSVVNINYNNDSLKSLLIVTDSKRVPFERRKHIRLPTSLYGIISNDNIIISEACIKDISYSGLRIYTNSQFEIDDQVDINVFFLNETGLLKCSFVRKANRYEKMEYGLNIIHDKESMELIEKIIESIRNSYSFVISDLIHDGTNDTE